MIGAPTDPLDATWAGEVLGRAAEAGISHRSKADVQEALDGWDLFVLPSRMDPFPIAMLEAMAAGLPVVGTEVDGIAEMLADGAGVLCPGDDPAALAESIRMLANQEEERRRLGAAARSRVASRYSLAHQVDGIESAYLAALNADG
jgi:glycosyltransferase involved in cell wall biosynthesis